MFGFTAGQLFGFTVLAAVVTTGGNLFATVLKDFLFARSFEKWKARQTLRQVAELQTRAQKELASMPVLQPVLPKP